MRWDHTIIAWLCGIEAVLAVWLFGGIVWSRLTPDPEARRLADMRAQVDAEITAKARRRLSR